MDNYKVTSLQCMSLIQTVTANYMSQFDGANSYSQLIPFSQTDRDTINAEFESYGISNVSNFYGWKRKVNSTFMDYTAPGGSATHCALFVPVSGCENTLDTWYSGNYTLEESITPNGIKFFKVIWNSEPVIIDTLEIASQPVLCKVSMPRNSTYNGTDYRVTCSLRFSGNETFESIAPLLP